MKKKVQSKIKMHGRPMTDLVDRFKALNVQPGDCLICMEDGLFVSMILIVKEHEPGDIVQSKMLRGTKEYECKRIERVVRGFCRMDGWFNFGWMREGYFTKIDPQRFLKLDKQIGILNAAINALQSEYEHKTDDMI